MKNRSDKERFEVAVTGLELAVRKENMVRRQIIGLILLCIVFYILFEEWWFVKQTAILGTITIVTEILNSCVERVCDYIQPKKDEEIRKVKDMLAGATLFSAIVTGLITAVDLIILIQTYM